MSTLVELVGDDEAQRIRGKAHEFAHSGMELSPKTSPEIEAAMRAAAMLGYVKGAKDVIERQQERNARDEAN